METSTAKLETNSLCLLGFHVLLYINSVFSSVRHRTYYKII